MTGREASWRRAGTWQPYSTYHCLLSDAVQTQSSPFGLGPRRMNNTERRCGLLSLASILQDLRRSSAPRSLLSASCNFNGYKNPTGRETMYKGEGFPMLTIPPSVRRRPLPPTVNTESTPLPSVRRRAHAHRREGAHGGASGIG